MTIACLLANTVTACYRSQDLSDPEFTWRLFFGVFFVDSYFRENIYWSFVWAQLLKNIKTHDSFLKLALRKSVIRRALRIALIVGCILALINHGDRIIFQDMKSVDWFKILLTFCVPYCVSTISSVLAIKREIEINES